MREDKEMLEQQIFEQSIANKEKIQKKHIKAKRSVENYELSLLREELIEKKREQKDQYEKEIQEIERW